MRDVPQTSKPFVASRWAISNPMPMLAPVSRTVRGVLSPPALPGSVAIFPTAQRQGDVAAAKRAGVLECNARSIGDRLGDNRHNAALGIEFGDVGGHGREPFLQGEATERCLHCAREGKTVSRETLGAANPRYFAVLEHAANGAAFGDVADGGGRAVRVDVINFSRSEVCIAKLLFHRPFESFAGGLGREHVVT